MVRETLRIYFKVTRQYPVLFSVAIISSIVFWLTLDIAIPFILSRIIDLISQISVKNIVLNDFKNLFTLFVIADVIYFISGRISMGTVIRLEPKVMRDLDNLCFARLQSHAYSFFANSFTGALVTKVNRFTNAYERIFDTFIFDLLALATQIIFGIIVIMTQSIFFGIVFFLWTTCFVLSVILLTRYKIKFSKEASAADSFVTARLADAITNILNIKIFARSKTELMNFRKISQNRQEKRLKSNLIGEYVRIYKVIVLIVVELLILYYSITLSLSGEISVGFVVLIQLYMAKILQSIWNIGKSLEKVEEALADATEMTEILIMPNEITDPEHPKKFTVTQGRVDYKNVSFSYRKEGTKNVSLFRNFSVSFASGEKVGLVGPSGGGKTTLTKLLLRFMDVDKGLITIDGQNIAEVSQEDLRKKIAYVPQEPILFHRSLLENIAYGFDKASIADVHRVAKLAHASDFIDKLPNGYETLVGERGIKLSGGEKQRVAIARAMLKHSPILLLDEATSSLDSESESYIQESFIELMKNKTTIVIAHRLSTIRRLDRIIVIDGGMVIEEGTHNHLLSKKGVYERLWRHQTGGFLE